MNEGWQLLKPERAGILQDGFIWAPPSALNKMDLAAHRREAILHILESSPSGFQTVQIVTELKRWAWVRAPINKDLIKEDMEVLSTQKKVRRGSSKKWGIVRESQA